jgi:HD-GYP domain-containing protein (c-di-GMP phosphodiesterase class II)
MPRIRLSVHELRIGMYVTKLDLPWFRSPFLRHSFLIEHASQIERLVQAGVTTVAIDLDRGMADAPGVGLDNLEPIQNPCADGVPSGRTRPVKSLAQLSEEYAQAKVAQQQLEQAVHSVFSSIAKTGIVQPEQAAEAVQEITIVARTLPRPAMFMALSQHRAGNDSLSHHALATCTLSLVIGQSFQLNPLELQELATAALLHDIGLFQVPAAVIRRSRVTSKPLSQQEQLEFRAHPRLSALALERQGRFESAVLDLVANHHPFPSDNGARAQAEPASVSDRSGILMLADQYDELITGFGGASPLSPVAAIQRLYLTARHGSAARNLLTHFIRIVGIYPVHSYVKLNTSEAAMVTDINPDKLHQPIVTITHQPGWVECPAPFIVDLAHQDDQEHPRAIESVLDGPPGSSAAGSFHAA